MFIYISNKDLEDTNNDYILSFQIWNNESIVLEKTTDTKNEGWVLWILQKNRYLCEQNTSLDVQKLLISDSKYSVR